MDAPDRPSRELLARQSERLAGLRARALRKAGISHRRTVLDLGAGHGAVTAELELLSGGVVVAVDHAREVLAGRRGRRVVARADALPFRSGAFELVFAQLVLLWAADLPAVVREIARVLAPPGALVALEPDFGGLIEEPPALAVGDVWRAALRRAGADPLVGRHLVRELERAGFVAQTDLSPALTPAEDDRFALLDGLPLTEEERATVKAARAADAATPSAEKVVHLPMFCVVAMRRR